MKNIELDVNAGHAINQIYNLIYSLQPRILTCSLISIMSTKPYWPENFLKNTDHYVILSECLILRILKLFFFGGQSY